MDDDLVGLAYAEADELARSRGWTTRRVREGNLVTMEYREDRLTLTVDEDDVVVGVRQG